MIPHVVKISPDDGIDLQAKKPIRHRNAGFGPAAGVLRYVVSY